MEWIEVVMEEYKTLREESLTAMQLQQAVLRYGLALVGLLVATALHLWADVIAFECPTAFVHSINFLSHPGYLDG